MYESVWILRIVWQTELWASEDGNFRLILRKQLYGDSIRAVYNPVNFWSSRLATLLVEARHMNTGRYVDLQRSTAGKNKNVNRVVESFELFRSFCLDFCIETNASVPPWPKTAQNLGSGKKWLETKWTISFVWRDYVSRMWMPIFLSGLVMKWIWTVGFYCFWRFGVGTEAE